MPEAIALLGETAGEPAALNALAVDPSGLNSDIHAEAAFRAHLITVMAKRAIAAALASA